MPEFSIKLLNKLQRYEHRKFGLGDLNQAQNPRRNEMQIRSNWNLRHAIIDTRRIKFILY